MAFRPIELRVKLFLKNSDGSVSPEELERSRRALTWMMTGMVGVNREFLELYPRTPPLYDSNVVYKPETKTEEWQDIPTTLVRGYGDCEDLAMYRCADLQFFEGINALPYVTWRQASKGNWIYHALVRYPNGVIEDPSRALGMNGLPIRREPYILGTDAFI